MKPLLLSLIALATAILPAYAVKKVDANPINIAHSIAEKRDSAKIASTLDYYGYISQPSQDGYEVFTHPNGSEIRYTFSENGEHQNYPKVQVFTKAIEKSKQETLSFLRFTKTKNYYERRNSDFDRYTMQCHNGPKGSLIFHRIRNRK